MKKYGLILVGGMLLAAFVAGGGSFWLGKLVGSAAIAQEVKAQALPRSLGHEKNTTKTLTAQKETSKKIETISSRAVVDLPLGQVFMYTIPAGDSRLSACPHPNRDVYVTYNRTIYASRGPRLITFWQSGDMPHTWNVCFYVQEH